MPDKKPSPWSDRKIDEYTWDDMGNAERFVVMHGSQVRYSPALGGWMEWDGERWALDVAGQVVAKAKAVVREMRRALDADDVSFSTHDLSDGEVVESDEAKAFRRFAKQSASRAQLNAMVELARSEPRMYAAGEDFDDHRKTGRVVNVSNRKLTFTDEGVKVSGHRRSDLMTRIAPVEYDASAKAPQWEKFLREKLPNREVRRFVQKLIAYSMISQNPRRLLIILLGDTSTGKTTILEVLEGMFGEGYITTFDMSLFRAKYDEAPRSDIVDVISKRLIYKSESNRSWELHSDVVKQMTGRDHVKARLPHKGDFITKVPEFTPWIATNKVPTVTDAGPALWRRLVIVPFAVPHFDDDLSLVERIVAGEGEGVLNWIIDGWDAYLREGLDLPAEVVEATIEHREEMDPFDIFLRDHVEIDASYKVTDKDLWDKYREWVVNSDMKRMDKSKFKHALEDRGYKSDRKQKDGEKKGNKAVFWFGLQLPQATVRQPIVQK